MGFERLLSGFALAGLAASAAPAAETVEIVRGTQTEIVRTGEARPTLVTESLEAGVRVIRNVGVPEPEPPPAEEPSTEPEPRPGPTVVILQGGGGIPLWFYGTPRSGVRAPHRHGSGLRFRARFGDVQVGAGFPARHGPSGFRGRGVLPRAGRGR